MGSELIFQSTGDGGGFAKMLYYLKAQPEHAAAKLLALKSIDPETKVEFLPPLSHIPEMKEVREEETVRLVEAIVDTGDYDAVVLDLDSIPEDRVQAAFSQSDVILWLLQDDRNHLHKAALLYTELQKAARWKPGALSFILNRYTGRLVNDFSSLPWEIRGHFPYVPEWKEVRESKQLKEQPIFREQVMQWYLRYGRGEATPS
ncbi:hypothetical protein N6H14_29575 [Paenibacillus sp. CC-CFT747]|nr:hypothetical protein N6H14_29575 [Paenibacillus sp. CC-CFT747]